MRMRHKKTGHIYSVVCLGVEEATLAAVVCYMGLDGMMWTRPASEFFDGRFEVMIPHPAEAQTIPPAGVMQ